MRKARVILHALGVALVTFGTSIVEIPDGSTLGRFVPAILISTGLSLNAAAVVLEELNGGQQVGAAVPEQLNGPQ